MTEEQEASIQAINEGYDKVIAHLDRMREIFINDVRGGQDYGGITADDALIWYIESF